jgi:rod shape determining protein RodA
VSRSTNIYKTVDWTVVIIYFLLVLFGWLNIYAAVYNEEHRSIIDLSQRYGKQLLWIGVAIVLIVIIFLVDGRIFEYLSYPIYFIAIVSLLGVLFVGEVTNNSKSWFEIGSFKIQPAEFAKVATSLVLARVVSIYDFKIDRIEDFLKASGLIALPFLLILLQNDLGSALVYASFIIVYYREGLSPWYFLVILLFVVLFILSLLTELTYIFIGLPLLAIIIFHLVYRNAKMTIVVIMSYSLVVILLILNQYFFHYNSENVLAAGILISTTILIYPAYKKRLRFFSYIAIVLVAAIAFSFSVDYIFHNILEKHQRTRINVVLGLESDPQGVEYNVNQSKIAIGSGAFAGKGFLQGTQTKFDFVPEQDTDFIFCTVGEEWGFIGTSLVLLLFGILIVRIIRIAERQRTRYNRVFGYCVASILFFHIVINIGMTIGLTPVIGIPLPFFSYGGSSLWAFTILLFILVKLDSTRLDKF